MLFMHFLDEKLRRLSVPNKKMMNQFSSYEDYNKKVSASNEQPVEVSMSYDSQIADQESNIVFDQIAEEAEEIDFDEIQPEKVDAESFQRPTMKEPIKGRSQSILNKANLDHADQVLNSLQEVSVENQEHEEFEVQKASQNSNQNKINDSKEQNSVKDELKDQLSLNTSKSDQLNSKKNGTIIVQCLLFDLDIQANNKILVEDQTIQSM